MKLIYAALNDSVVSDELQLIHYLIDEPCPASLTFATLRTYSFDDCIIIADVAANTAASFMGLAWFATYSVFMLSQIIYEDTSLTAKLLLSLISNAAMGFAFQMIVICEGTTRGNVFHKKNCMTDKSYIPLLVTGIRNTCNL